MIGHAWLEHDFDWPFPILFGVAKQNYVLHGRNMVLLAYTAACSHYFTDDR